MKLIFATHNIGKLKEMRSILSGLDIEVLSAEEAGINDEVAEDGKTLEDNALKKARFVAEKSGFWSIADDTGLFIEALEGQPGVYSARWAGENSSDKQKVDKVLGEMKNVPPGKRQAYFESVVALVSPKGEEKVFSGKINGMISQSPRGQSRPKLPYDDIFIPEGYNRTFAEMSDEEKNNLSYRGQAFKKLKEFLKNHVKA